MQVANKIDAATRRSLVVVLIAGFAGFGLSARLIECVPTLEYLAMLGTALAFVTAAFGLFKLYIDSRKIDRPASLEENVLIDNVGLVMTIENSDASLKPKG